MDLIIKARKKPYGHEGYTRVVNGKVQYIGQKGVKVIVNEGTHPALVRDQNAGIAAENLQLMNPSRASAAVQSLAKVFETHLDPVDTSIKMLDRLNKLGVITLVFPEGTEPSSALGEESVIEGPHGERIKRIGSYTPKVQPELWASRELISIPQEAPEPPSYAASFTYLGKTIKVSGLASRMLDHWTRLMKQHERGQHRVRNWDTICTNFSKDFSDALKRPIDVSKLRMKDVEHAIDLFEREGVKEKLRKKEARDREKAKLKAQGKKPEKREYKILQDGTVMKMAGGVMAAERIYIGGGEGVGLGRWIPRSTYARSVINISKKNAPSKKLWPGEVAEDTTAEWIMHEKLGAGIHGQDPFPGKTKVKTTQLHKSTEFKRKQRVAHFENVRKMMEKFPVIERDIIADLKSSNSATRELAFALMLAHTMHARSGSGESDTATGILQFTEKTILDDKGNYYFLAKDQIEADSKYHKQLKYTGKGPKDPVYRPPLAGGPGGLKSFPGALDVFHELKQRASHNPVKEGTNEHYLFSQNMKLGARMVAWLRLRVPVEGLKVHDFRAAHGNTYFDEEWAKHKKDLDVAKKLHGVGTPKMKQAVVRLVNHCSDVVAIKLGHRRRPQVMGTQKLTAAEKKKLATKEKSPAADVELGSATTRGSYLDMIQVHEKCVPYGVTGLKPSEVRDVLGLDVWPPVPVKGGKKAKKSILYLSEWLDDTDDSWVMKADISDAPELSPQERWALSIQVLDEILARLRSQIAASEAAEQDDVEESEAFVVKSDPLAKKYSRKIPTCRYCNRQAIYIIFTNTREKIPVCKVHMKLKTEMSKAILTKKEKAPKPAKAPSKASGKSVNPKTGKKTYQYKGQNPTSGGKTGPKAGAKKKPPEPQAAVDVPQPPPKIDIDQLAAALKTTKGALQHFAKQFKDAAHFVAHFQAKMGSFTLKHKVGPDKLRRLYETLREDDTPAPRV